MDEALLSQLPAELTVDVDGKNTPLRDVPFIKDAKDWPSFAKTAFDVHREVGSRIPTKIDSSKPEEVKKWRETHIPTLQKAGLLHTPPSDYKDYGVVKPADMPEGLMWSDERGEKFAKVLHKYGVPKEMAGELMELNKEAMLHNVNFVKTTMAEGIQGLKTEYGDKYDSMVEDVKRLTDKIFTSPDELALFTATGLGNHPKFLSVMMRLAQVAKGDSSFLPDTRKGGGTGSMTGEEARAEYAKILNDDKHPDHAGYMRNDPEVMSKIEKMYQAAYGTGQVTL